MTGAKARWRGIILVLGMLFAMGAACSFADEKDATIITYYPSPNGVYEEFRLSPRAGPDAACDANRVGTIYYDSSKNKFLVCTQEQNGDYAYSDPCFVKGMAQAWSGGSRLPAGWQLCDGSNGTKDLRNLFIKGANSVGTYTSGGSNSISLGVSNLPSHSHGVSGGGTTDSEGLHTHTFGVTENQRDFQFVGMPFMPLKTCFPRDSGCRHAGAHAHGISFSVNSASAGGSAAFDNQPEFYTLAYICYVGD